MFEAAKFNNEMEKIQEQIEKSFKAEMYKFGQDLRTERLAEIDAQKLEIAASMRREGVRFPLATEEYRDRVAQMKEEVNAKYEKTYNDKVTELRKSKMEEFETKREEAWDKYMPKDKGIDLNPKLSPIDNLSLKLQEMSEKVKEASQAATLAGPQFNNPTLAPGR